MKPTNKAILLSSFVFPGAGQIFLKRKRLGTGLIVVALAALSVLLVHTFTVSRGLVDKIISGDLQPDILELSEMISDANTPATNWATLILLTSWLVSISDAWLAGRTNNKHPDSRAT